MTLIGRRGAAPRERRARGERNNNPLCLRALPGERAWNGQTGADETGIAIYATPELGIRAGVLQIRRHVERGRSTILQLVSVWAPAGVDNNPPAEHYADAVVAHMRRALEDPSISAHTVIDLEDGYQVLELARGMARHECGYVPWDDATWLAGMVAAGYGEGRRSSLTRSRTVGGAIGAGAGTLGTAAAIASQWVREAASDPAAVSAATAAAAALPPWYVWVPIVISLVSLGIVLWARYDDWRMGLR